MNLKIAVVVSLLFFSFVGRAEEAAPAPVADPNAQAAAPAADPNAGPAPASTAPAVQIRRLAVLPTTDTSDLKLGQTVQATLASLFQQTNYYTVQQVNAPLNSFTEPEVFRLYQATNSEIIAFAYLEKERLSLFLFDNTHGKEYVAVSQNLIDPMMGNQVNAQVVEYKLKLSFNQLIAQYFQNIYQPLPGSQQQALVAETEPDDPIRRAEMSRKLFRELASLQETKYYLGATIGMARFSGGGGSASSVSFGGFGGMKLNEQFKGEAGLSLFSYSLAYLDFKYLFPLAEKYVSLYGSVGLGRVLGAIMGPRFDFEPSLNPGGFMFGPGFSFDIPLLGAYVRGELKLYFGGGTILMGTYGIMYSI